MVASAAYSPAMSPPTSSAMSPPSSSAMSPPSSSSIHHKHSVKGRDYSICHVRSISEPMAQPQSQPQPSSHTVVREPSLDSHVLEQQNACEHGKPSTSSKDAKQETFSEFVGAGLNNLGNTCYMNSILQCLIHTPSLIQTLALHKQTLGYEAGHNEDLSCMLCTMYNIVQLSIRFTGQHYSPKGIHSKLSVIAKQFLPGRQEDAHEFLRLLLDAIDVTAGKQNGDNDKVKQIINHSFGGKMQSLVICSECNKGSGATDPIQDLSLEIDDSHIESIEDAMKHFTTTETLDGDNKYFCESCKKKVKAYKQIRIRELPPILIVQLKRFQLLDKISKSVSFSEGLSIKCYESVENENLSDEKKRKRPSDEEKEKNVTPVIRTADLYAVVVHSGLSKNRGHYYCYVKRGKSWYKFNDSFVSKASWDDIKMEEAYMLFYKTKFSPSVASEPISGNQNKICHTNATAKKETPTKLASQNETNKSSDELTSLHKDSRSAVWPRPTSNTFQVQKKRKLGSLASSINSGLNSISSTLQFLKGESSDKVDNEKKDLSTEMSCKTKEQIPLVAAATRKPFSSISYGLRSILANYGS